MESGASPIIVAHSLAHAVAALQAAAAAACPVVLLSAPDAAVYGGAGWWCGLVAAAREAMPAARCTSVLDCGDDAGAAQAAVRAGVEEIVFTGHPDVAMRLTDIAAQRGTRIVTERPTAALDLADMLFAAPDALNRRCRAMFATPAS